jgi:3-mercaptopyruvate sulfurtransferase SseA
MPTLFTVALLCTASFDHTAYHTAGLHPRARFARSPSLNGRTQLDDLSSVPRMPLDEFKKLLSTNQIVVIDVRDAGSYKRGHIPGAESIPLDQLRANVGKLKATKKPIVAYCA